MSKELPEAIESYSFFKDVDARIAGAEALGLDPKELPDANVNSFLAGINKVKENFAQLRAEEGSLSKHKRLFECVKAIDLVLHEYDQVLEPFRDKLKIGDDSQELSKSIKEESEAIFPYTQEATKSCLMVLDDGGMKEALEYLQPVAEEAYINNHNVKELLDKTINEMRIAIFIQERLPAEDKKLLDDVVTSIRKQSSPMR